MSKVHNPDSDLIKMIKKNYRDVSEAYTKKIKDMFGVDWDTVCDLLGEVKKPAEFELLVAMAPIIIVSLTSKDEDWSIKIMKTLSKLECMAKFNIHGRKDSKHTVNKTLLRLFSLVVVNDVIWDSLDQSSTVVKSAKKAKNTVSVLNPSGEGSQVKKEIAAAAAAKLEAITDLQRSDIKDKLRALFGSSLYVKREAVSSSSTTPAVAVKSGSSK